MAKKKTSAKAEPMPEKPTVEEHFDALGLSPADLAFEYAAFMAEYRPGRGKRLESKAFAKMRAELMGGPISGRSTEKEG